MQSLRSVVGPLAFLATALASLHSANAQSQTWIKQFGTSADDEALGAAPDGSGGVYVCGVTFGSLGGPSAGGDDGWFARYDSAGNQLWLRQLGSSSDDLSAHVIPDGSGGLFMCGSTYGSLGGPFAGAVDAWFGRYDGAGNQLWIRQLGSSGADYCRRAAPDGSGGLYLLGETNGSLVVPSHGGDDVWFARYDGAGNQLWIRQIGTSFSEYSGGVVPDGSGGTYICGATNSNLGGTNAGLFDAWVARYDGVGQQLWIRQLGTSTTDVAARIVSDGLGGCFLLGTTYGGLGGASQGGLDVWTARYDSGGNRLWVRQLGTVGDDLVYDATPDGLGGMFIAGSTTGVLGRASAGWWDAWFAQCNSAGSVMWIHQLGTSAVDESHGIAQEGSGGVFICGRTLGNLAGASAGGSDVWLEHYVTPLTLSCEPGVGSVMSCPCSNPPSGPGRGCDNSAATGGATIATVGLPVLTSDTLSFTAENERPTATSVLVQGTSQVSLGTPFGQGVRCTGGALKRLYVHSASAGVVTMPDFGSGDVSISSRSTALGDTILAGQSRWYSIYYRDPVVLGGCPAQSTFNTGPTVRADWQP